MRLTFVVCMGSAVASIACGSPPPSSAPPRPLRGSPFVCTGDSCVQAFPTYPDDGEWECIDLEGVVVCRGGVPAAGVRPGPADGSFECAALAGDVDQRRVCIDVTPDVPADAPRHAWRCAFRREGATEERACMRDDGGVRVGAPCDGSRACPAGLRCDEDRCARARTDPPECWLDADCEGGRRCVLAHCEAR